MLGGHCKYDATATIIVQMTREMLRSPQNTAQLVKIYRNSTHQNI